jgi:transposase-like protein
MRACSCSGAAAGRSRSWADELGCSPQSLRNWSRHRFDEGKTKGLSSDERDELRWLRREVKVLAEEREILKSRGLLRLGEQDPVKVFGLCSRARPTTPSR